MPPSTPVSLLNQKMLAHTFNFLANECEVKREKAHGYISTLVELISCAIIVSHILLLYDAEDAFSLCEIKLVSRDIGSFPISRSWYHNTTSFLSLQKPVGLNSHCCWGNIENINCKDSQILVAHTEQEKSHRKPAKKKKKKKKPAKTQEAGCVSLNGKWRTCLSQK